MLGVDASTGKSKTHLSQIDTEWLKRTGEMTDSGEHDLPTMAPLISVKTASSTKSTQYMPEALMIVLFLAKIQEVQNFLAVLTTLQ